jgi:hypothetical protein
MSTIALLIDEAWERHRGRRRREWVAALLVGMCLLALVSVGPLRPASSGAPVPSYESPAELVAGGSYLAIHCPEPNSIACDQLALAVTLKRPARAITATIDGHSWPMNRRGDELDSSARPRREFDGYFSHAGIRSRLHVHPGPGNLFINDARAPGIHVPVRLVVELPSGKLVGTRLRLYLRDGWG